MHASESIGGDVLWPEETWLTASSSEVASEGRLNVQCSSSCWVQIWRVGRLLPWQLLLNAVQPDQQQGASAELDRQRVAPDPMLVSI